MSKFRRARLLLSFLFLGTVFITVGIKAVAADNSDISGKLESLEIFTNSLWLVVAGALVFFMNAGFAFLEAGTCSQKSLINVLAKNVIVFCIATMAFWLVGFNLMFGDGANWSDNTTYTCPTENIYSYRGDWNLTFQLPFPTLDISKDVKGANPLGYPDKGFSCLKEMSPNRSFAALFVFQLVFAGVAATIVSGAVAERVNFLAFCLFSFFFILIIYPWVGHWAWGPFGWLAQKNFRDFAGSTVVHSVGGTAALVGAWLLGPRWTQFKYDPQNEIVEYDETNKIVRYLVPDGFKESLTIPYNLGFVTLGGFILWLGWIGFNGGSTTNLSYVPHIVATTLAASASGGIASIVAVQAFGGDRPSLGTFINGVLGGLVAITASSAYVSFWQALFIGVISGPWVIFCEKILLPNAKIDDPVGAIPVHLGGGFWGTLAVGFFASSDSLVYGVSSASPRWSIILWQLAGWFIICFFTAFGSFIFWSMVGLFSFWITWESKDSRRKLLDQNVGLIKKLFLWTRHGIRVSVVEEFQGTYNFFGDAERLKREGKLRRVPNQD